MFKRLVSIVFLSAVVFIGCGKPAEQTQVKLGTVVSVKFYQSADKDLFESFFSLIDHYEALFSRKIPGSDIDRINVRPGTPVPVDSETITLLAEAEKYYRYSRGLFDPTVAPLVDLWGIDTDHPRIPSEEELTGILAAVDFSQIYINRENNTVMLNQQGSSLDLGGLAKGYICDRCVEYLKAAGVESAIVNMGGNVYALGEKPDGSPFSIGIQDPYNPRGSFMGVLKVKDYSVVTSGIYERYFERDGIRYHHILDPRTGRPAETGLASVTIISKTSVEGDGLSTTVFLLGITDGLTLVERFPGTEAVLITTEKEVLLSSGAGKFFTLTSGEYHVSQETGEAAAAPH